MKLPSSLERSRRKSATNDIIRRKLDRPLYVLFSISVGCKKTSRNFKTNHSAGYIIVAVILILIKKNREYYAK